MKITKQTRIGVLLGGLSKEREISLKTGKAMAQALQKRGYQVVEEIDVGKNIVQRLKDSAIEVAVIALHGRYGEDGSIQGLLEYLEIPYTGSGVTGSAIAMDKIASKKLFQAYGIPTPPWIKTDQSWEISKLKNEIHQKLGFPAVAKPVCEGSTIGVSVVNSSEGISTAQKEALAFSDAVIWEEFISGKELTVSILKNRPLPIVEIVPKKGIFDYQAKYTKGMTNYFCPARLPEREAILVQNEAVKAFQAVHAQSFGRVDLMYKEGTPWIFEVNTIPGMTETSLLPQAAQVEGKTFEDVMEIILQDAGLKIKK